MFSKKVAHFYFKVISIHNTSGNTNSFAIRGFSVWRLEELVKKLNSETSGNPNMLHRVESFSMLVLKSEKATHELDFHTINLSKGDCLLLSKGQVQGFDKNHIYKGILIEFAEDFIEHLISHTALKRVMYMFNYHLNTPLYSNLDLSTSFLKEVNLELKNFQNDNNPEVLVTIITLYLLRLERLTQNHDSNIINDKKYDIFNRFNKKVEDTYHLTRDAKSYANFIGISYKHLNEVCKSLTNKTAKEFIDDFILLEAKRLLVTTTLSSKDVSYVCGFDEPTNFVKYFKKQVGITPTAFRAKHLSQQ